MNLISMMKKDQTYKEHIDEKILVCVKQLIKIEKNYETLQKKYKSFKPKKIEFQYYRNKILGKDNMENIILMFFPYLIQDDFDIEIPSEEKEVIEIAVNWWVEQIKRPLPECGDPFWDAFARMSEAKYEPLTDANISMFKVALFRLLAYELQKNGEIQLGTNKNFKTSFYLKVVLYLANINKTIYSYNSSMVVSKGDVKLKKFDSDIYRSIKHIKRYSLTK